MVKREVGATAAASGSLLERANHFVEVFSAGRTLGSAMTPRAASPWLLVTNREDRISTHSYIRQIACQNRC